MKDKFIQFLKDNDAFDAYFNAFTKQRRCEFDEYFDKRAHNQYVQSGFIWDDSDDGWVYWNKLNRKWHEYITAINPA